MSEVIWSDTDPACGRAISPVTDHPSAGERTYPMNPLGDEIGETDIADSNQGMTLLECIDAGYDPVEGARMHAEFMEGHGDDSDV